MGVIIYYTINFNEIDRAAFFIILGVCITIGSIYRIYKLNVLMKKQRAH